jgi:bifunctional oligoribonuclease and PAP phosphatase NrnA
MIAPPPEDTMTVDRKSLSEAKKMIDEARRILIIPHANVDPDGLSSALACSVLFTAVGKECTVLCPDALPESLEFLPGFDKLSQEIDSSQDFIVTLDLSRGVELEKLQYAIEGRSVNIIVTPKKGIFEEKDVSFRDGPFPFDLIIVVDTADLALLGSLYEEHRSMFDKIAVLNIDHHVSNTGFGTTKIIDSTAASATEVLFHWWSQVPGWKEKITSDVATLLLTGLITDTRSFQNPNTTPRSLETAAELLELGARQQEIIRYVYKTKPLSTLRIWGRALNRMQVNAKDRIVWSAISHEDLVEMEAQSKETHGIIDELLTTIPDADVYVLFTETENGGLKASMRSSDKVDVSSLAKSLFGGGGHARAAGFKLKGYDNFQIAVAECVQKIVQKIQRRHTHANDHMAQAGEGKNEGGIDVVQKLAG